MAEKRMFSKAFTDKDSFTSLPLPAQALYFHLCMNADDDGFITNAKSIMRTIGARTMHLGCLIDAQLVYKFVSSVYLIKHWKLHNCVQSDRYRATNCKEKSLIKLNSNKEYVISLEESNDSWIQNGNKLDTTWKQNVSKMDTDWKQNGYSLDTQIRLDLDIDKNSKEKEKENIKRKEKETLKISNTLITPTEDEKSIKQTNGKRTIKKFIKPTIEEIDSYCKERKNSINPEKFYNYYESIGWVVGKNPMKDWKSAIRTWESNTKNNIATSHNNEPEEVGVMVGGKWIAG